MLCVSSSQDHLPSLSAVRREEDMFMLPALPAQEEERERSSSDEEEQVEEDSRHIYQVRSTPTSCDGGENREGGALSSCPIRTLDSFLSH